MKPHSGYQAVETHVPFKGLASSFPKTRIPAGYASDLLNVTVRDGVVRRRAGYLKIGQTLDGIVLDLIEFAKIGATERLIAFTSKAQYWFDADNNNWVDISIETPWTYTITVVDVATKKFSVNEDLRTSENHLDIGTKFVIAGSTGNDGTYTVVDAVGTTPTVVEVSEVIPDTTADGSIIVTRREDIDSATSSTRTLVFDLIDLTGYISAGDTIYIKDSTGNDGVYTVDTIVFSTDTTIVVIETLPDDTNDGYISHRVDRTYTEGDLLNSEPVTDIRSRRLLHTNGVQNPIQWFGDTADVDGNFLRWVPLYPNFVSCQTLKVFKESLFLGNIQTTEDELSLIAWSDSGLFDNFTDGNSGVQVLYELATGIQQTETLGDRIVIYSKDALAAGIFVGIPLVFAFETIIPAGTRLASGKGLTSINVGHIYASEENFYLFDGSRGLRTLADVIRTDYKVVKDQNNIHQINMLNDFSKKTIFIAVPSPDGIGIVYTMEYDAFNLARRAWSKEEYNDFPRAFGFFTNTFVYTWDDTTQEAALAAALGLSFLPWSEEIGNWSNEGEQADFPVRAFGDENGFVYISTEGVLSDNGTNRPGFYTTGDFTVPQEFLSTLGRWGEIEFEASGDTVDVSAISEDGQVVKVTEVVTLEGTIQVYRVPIDVNSRMIRVKFSFTGDFRLHWVRCWVKSGAPR